MSGQIIPTPAYKASEWYNFTTLVEKQRLGLIALSLTNFDNESEPQIAAGSVIEISGSLFKFDNNDSIGGTPTSGQINYIMLEVSGSGDEQEVSGSWTTTAPTWNDAKQGWYDATGNKRYVGGCYYDGTNYKLKWVYLNRSINFQTNYYPCSLFGSTVGTGVTSRPDMIEFQITDDGICRTPIILMPGTIITKINGYSSNVGMGEEITVELRRRNMSTGTGDLMASFVFDITHPDNSDDSISYAAIDNEIYSYYLEIYVTAGTVTASVDGVRIEYILKPLP